MRRGAVVLCGGRSQRMGVEKAALPFGDETLLQRTVRLVAEGIDGGPLVVAAARDQALSLPNFAGQIVRDSDPFEGPLAALVAALKVLTDKQPDKQRDKQEWPRGVEAVFVTGCDTPLLRPALIRALFDALGDRQAAVPDDGQRRHVLAGVYRTTVLPMAVELLQQGVRSVQRLIDRIDVECVPPEALRRVDPDLDSLWNVNTPDDYRRALAQAGLDRST